MEALQIRRLDHLGIIAGTIKDLGIIEMIDARIPSDKQEAITCCGEAVAGMILNGLGFSQRPMTLTPQFFVNKPLEVLLRPGVKAEDFNRFKLGRSLEDLYHYGASALFEEIAAEACRREAVETRYTHGDTTSFSLTGEYDRECDQQALRLTYGYSKDHRPDLKQAVLELLVAQDGGVPLACRSWDGNQSDDLIFRQRAQQLIEVFGRSPLPRYLILDSKGYSEANAENLRHLP
ncbi:MAG: IS1634 family transposase, partial [Chloroflexi bacterium]|nr:IS1634 family transposase [Chloroflexota bacterium]